MRLMLAKLLPRSLSGRMTLILVLGLLAAQFASLLLHLQERATMLGVWAAEGKSLTTRMPREL
jgi:hypothetical protein